MIIVLILIVILALGFACDGAATSNLKRDSAESYAQLKTNHAKTLREYSQKNDVYYDPTTQAMDAQFYSDGSLKYDSTTGRGYQKGQYRCRSDGMGPNLNPVGPEVDRPPNK